MATDSELRVAFNGALSGEAPASLATEADIPTRPAGDYTASPANWQDYVLYFLLPDRFSDEKKRTLLNRKNVAACRPPDWRFDQWAKSGAERWQGGTLRGLACRLPYLVQLGVNAVWIAPTLRQRLRLNSYHGYGIQHFIDVDPRLGTRRDLVDLVAQAHEKGIRVILDIVFNHTGCNWWYVVDGAEQCKPAYKRWPDCYGDGRWLGADESPMSGMPAGSYDGVLPRELQDWDFYTRAGEGSLSESDVDCGHAEHKRTDFCGLRDTATDKDWVLGRLALLYKYWIALTDCDGFRLDTVKHVSKDEARNFCGAIKEYAARLGKHNFLLMAEVAGGDDYENKYLDACERNLSCVLDIGGARLALVDVAKGLQRPENFFNGFSADDPGMGSHRYTGHQHVSINEDHDAVMGRKVRFSAEIPDSQATKPYQVAVATSLQLFSLGIPCIYAGTEQALCGPEVSQQHWCPDWGGSDRYLREAMFGPEHPRPDAWTHTLAEQLNGRDPLPGFGPCGTAGFECFDEKHPAFVRIQAAIALRQREAVLRFGRQYLRQVHKGGDCWDYPNAGDLVPWSRILDVREALCIVNANGIEKRGGRVVVDAQLSPAGSSLIVLLNTAQAAAGSAYNGPYPVGSTVSVQRPSMSGPAFVEIVDLPPAETLVLSNGR
jgi:hypothetical protein